jgi:ATP-dependent exoDNAse (exonuclease V) beta subunit
MKIKNIYPYKDLKRNDGGIRTYETEDGIKFPSVTSILSETQSEEKKMGLAKWKKRVGAKESTRIKRDAAKVGTSMHKYLENYLLDRGYIDDTRIGRIARPMAKEIIKKGLVDLEELWGSEVHLYYPGLYAGTTDVVGIYKGKPAIVDFKQTNRPKQESWVIDYKLQLAAYAMAHNVLFDTKINTAVILMCSRDRYFQKFELNEKDYWYICCKWMTRVAEFYGD